MPHRSRRARLPSIVNVNKAMDSSEGEQDSGEDELSRINNPEEKDENPHDPIKDIAAPLDDLSEYSGEDFVNNVELGDSSIEDDALSADE